MEHLRRTLYQEAELYQLCVLHDLIDGLKLARRQRATLPLTPKGRALRTDPQRLLSEVTASLAPELTAELDVPLAQLIISDQPNEIDWSLHRLLRPFHAITIENHTPTAVTRGGRTLAAAILNARAHGPRIPSADAHTTLRPGEPNKETLQAARRQHARGRLLHSRDHLAAASIRPLLHRVGQPPRPPRGCTANPASAWVTQQPRVFAWTLHGQPSRFRYLIPDRDSKFSRSFDAVFVSEGIEMIKTPVRAPKTAIAERFVVTVRRECLDWLLIVNHSQLEHVLGIFVDHYNAHRPHRSLDLAPPAATVGQRPLVCSDGKRHDVKRRDRLGGLVHEYSCAA